MVVPRRVFMILSSLGDSTRATSEVEYSISMMATSPSLFSASFANGSVVYWRKPFEVPEQSQSPCPFNELAVICEGAPAIGAAICPQLLI